MVACMKLFSWAILALALAGCARTGAPAPVVDRTLTYDGIFAVASKAAASVGERVADSMARVVQEVREAPPAVAAPRPTVIVEDIDIVVAAADPVAAPKSLTVNNTWSTAAPGGTYRVAKGDTVYGIARRQGIDAKTVMALNDLKPPYTLRVGDQIRLPGGVPVRLDDNVDVTAAAPVSVKAIAVPKASTRPLPQAPSSTLSSAPAPVILASAGPGPKLRPQPPRRLATAAGPVGVPPARSGGGFAWPVKGPVLAAYGALDGGRFNDGLNIGAPRGTPVMAAENAVVVYAGNEIRGFGNLVLLKHEGGIITAYAHNDALLVRRGDMVGKGDQIARVGRSGGVTEPQLHFEIRRGTQAVDPNTLLAQQELAAR